MKICRKLPASRNYAPELFDLTRFDRVRLHLRCLLLDFKVRWHLAGVWRELRPRVTLLPDHPTYKRGYECKD